jgi:hypothetical protein
MKSWIKLAMAGVMLAGLMALLANCGAHPATTAQAPTVAQQATAWQAECGHAMFSQVSATDATFLTDTATYLASSDASAFESDANQDTYLLGQWQTCANAVGFDPQLRAALTAEVAATITLWSEYSQGTPMSDLAAQASSQVTDASQAVTGRLCTDDAAQMSC